MQNVLGTYSKYENDHSNSGNNMKPHRGDPISFPSPLRTQMPMKNRRIFGQCKAGSPFPAKGFFSSHVSNQLIQWLTPSSVPISKHLSVFPSGR